MARKGTRKEGVMTPCNGFKVALFLGVVAAAAPGYGQSALESERNIRVVQQQTLIRYHRAEVVPSISVGINEVVTRHIGVGAEARYHITDEWSAGLEYVKYFGSDSAIAEEISAFVGPKKRLMDFYVGAQGSWVPIKGKFLFFGKGPIHWDFHLIGGLGTTRTRSFHVTPSFGGAFRFLLWRFLTLHIGVRDYIYREEFNPEKRFINNAVFTCGVGAFVPFTYEYKFPK